MTSVTWAALNAAKAAFSSLTVEAPAKVRSIK
jgi:hypothetical protein